MAVSLSNPRLSAWFCIVLTLLTTTPSIARLTKTIFPSTRAQLSAGLYEDRDGAATKESQSRFSDRITRSTILILSVAGFCLSLATAILSTKSYHTVHLEPWLYFATWALETVQSTTVFVEPVSTKRQSLGLYGMISNLAIVVTLSITIGTSTRLDVRDISLQQTQAVIAACQVVLCVSIPRRPDVFHDGTIVDRQYSGSLLNRYSFAWGADILNLARERNQLRVENLPELDFNLRTHHPITTPDGKTNSQKLWRTIFNAHKTKFLTQWAVIFVLCLLQFLPQIFLLQFLKSLEARQQFQTRNRSLWIWIVALGLSVAVNTCIENSINWLSTTKIGLSVYEQVSAAVIAKGLERKDIKDFHRSEPEVNLSPLAIDQSPELKRDSAANQASTQSTINLLAVDTRRIAEFAIANHRIMSSVIKLIVSVCFIGRLVGIRSLTAGICASILTIPVNLMIAGKYSSSQKRLMKTRDSKLSMITEALQGIRQIKFSAFEPQWSKKIMQKRGEELQAQYTTFMYKACLIFVSLLGPAMLSVITLGAYSLLEGRLTASIAFTTLAVLNSVDTSLEILPELTTKFLNARISLTRVEGYLNSANKDRLIQPANSIVFENASLAWPTECDKSTNTHAFALRNVNLHFPNKELSIITGKVGSGKSLILASILGETDILDGVVRAPQVTGIDDQLGNQFDCNDWIVESAVAYVAQIPWIENATIKANILSGLPLKHERYLEVLHACALEPDLKALPLGDSTDIGANGVNLSGGQKWRLSLARALYSRAGILLFDDIFSAVDTKVGQHLYENALNGDLAKGRTRILVTHHLGLCAPAAKYLVSLANGTVENAGNTEEAPENGFLTKLAEEIPQQTANEPEYEASQAETQITRIDSYHSGKMMTDDVANTGSPHVLPFMTEETYEKGSTGTAVYLVYIRATGYFWSCLVCAAFASYAAIGFGRTFWVSAWTRSYGDDIPHISMAFSRLTHNSFLERGHTTKRLLSSDTTWCYLGVYAGLSLVSCVLGTARYFVLFKGSILVSRKLFDRMTYNILRMPLRWLDTVPLGRILNRFASDFDVVDSSLAEGYGYFLTNCLFMIGAVLAALAASYHVMLAVATLFAVCLYYARTYVIGAREVKRVESAAKSPIFEQFGSILSGISTIRAFGRSEAYTRLMHKRIDDWARANYQLGLFVRWVNFRLNIIGALFTTSIGAILVAVPGIDAALAGFCLTFVLQFAQIVIYGIRDFAILDMGMNAVERIAGYCDLQPENQSGLSVPAGWPTSGRMEVCNLSVSYAPHLDPVLSRISFSVEPHERIGVIGRTGAGKSSLALALFRFLDIRGGSIIIDGIDISKIKLQDLRSRVSIIPQDPVLFSGTLRSNLDPFDEYDDAVLFDALERSNLTEVRTKPSLDASESPSNLSTNIFDDLNSSISARGLNLSQGQRQLLCLARAVIARPKLLVLDEATSALDKTTDALIQRSIREEFPFSTLIIIAHRLSTVADFDKILVLNHGKVAEFDTPSNLLKKESGLFKSMVQHSGEKALIESMVS